MPSTTLTRKELYELIWSKPMTQVAKDFDVSDVWISKICKEANIPRPPVGYWQKLDAGKNPKKTALPPAKLLAADMMYIKSATPYWYGERDTRSDEDIVNAPDPVAPTFAESMEEFESRIASCVGEIKIPNKLGQIHPMIEKLIKEDDRRVTEMKAERWYWGRKPLYQSSEGQKLLIALNCLFLMWSQLGARPSVSHGRDLRCSVEFSNSHLPIAFNVVSQESQSKDTKSKDPVLYEFAWTYKDQYSDIKKDESYRTFKTITGEILRSLIIESIVRSEQRLRDSVMWTYKNQLKKRDDAAERIEQRRLAEIERRRKETEELIALRLAKVDETLVLFEKAEKIRQLIVAFDKKYEDHKDEMSNYENWRSWAEHYSNVLDPRHWSAEHVDKWIAGFKLKDR